MCLKRSLIKIVSVLVLSLSLGNSAEANESPEFDDILDKLGRGGAELVAEAELILENYRPLTGQETVRLGAVYFSNQTVEDNWRKSAAWLETYFINHKPQNKDVLAIAIGMLGRSYIKLSYYKEAFDLCDTYKGLVKDSHLGTNIAMCLGEIYQYGHGLDEDTDQAIYWYEQAVKLGDNEAVLELNFLKTEE